MLVQQLSQADRKAFEIIYSKYWRPLLDLAWKGLHDKQAAEDLVQGVFLSLWQKREQLHINNLEAYLKTAVRYKVLNYIVRTKRTHEFFESFHEIFQEKNTPETTLLTKNLQELIHAYAAVLPAKRREIFMLYIQSRLSTKEIAQTLALSQKTVQNQLGISLQGLRTRLTPVLFFLIQSHL
ncbi:MAG: RNA polymerase sigma-70 factor [Chitinophagaceae bacterium]|nr:RNA polymerase sigma-70 factor [Chitinophagaceae bacterium]